MTEQEYSADSYKQEEPRWYVVHTYSGYENKVKDSLEKIAENNEDMQALIQEVYVPVEEVSEIRNGKKIIVNHKTFPGYVLVKMIMTNRSWFVVRNTRGVTGFVGPESKPVPLTEQEVENMRNSKPITESCSFTIGEEVRIVSGTLENFTGIVEAIDIDREKLQVKIKMFLGREMQIEVAFSEAKKL